MTTTVFDAPASMPRLVSGRFFLSPRKRPPNPSKRPVVRIAWMIALFAKKSYVSYDEYHRRFACSHRTFQRDLTALRDAGLYLEPHPSHGYRMVWFGPAVDAG
jgi:biotin operon repressor